MEGIKMRWAIKSGNRKVLQYSVKQDITIRAGMWSPEERIKTAKYEWSDWIDVPEVFLEEK